MSKLNFSDNALDKSKLMWGNDFDPETIRTWVGKGAFVDWHNPDEHGCTIVHMVAKVGKMDALRALVELNADLNAMNNRRVIAVLFRLVFLFLFLFLFFFAFLRAALARSAAQPRSSRRNAVSSLLLACWLA